MVEANGHTVQEALDVEEEVLEEAEEMEEEDHQEHAITATRPVTWQEIVQKNEENDEVDSVVVEEVEAEAGHVTIAMKKDTWQENVHQETDVKFGS